MAARIVTQVIVTGAQIFGRAFVEAYRKVAADAAAQAASRRTAAGAADHQTGITTDEALLILNVERTTPVEEIAKKYDHLFKANDPANGGSFYLQSKVFRAKERLELELGARAAAAEREAAAKGAANGGPGAAP
ncbi:Pam16-domain-containing protein [Zopfochytrium polystomum]|nr:Pam16-domain-containing protein [Zopfochytrium polystomum]